eukprot:scaffold10020_cov161-Skeletonema_marinoi.AAC.21
MSPFAGHVRSMIYDGRLMMPSSSQLDNAGQATNYYKLFASLQNIEVEHCRDAGDTRPSVMPTKTCLMYTSSMQLLIHEETFLDDPHGRQDALRKRHSTVREALDVATSIDAEASNDMSPVDANNSYPGNWGVACDGMLLPLTKRGAWLHYCNLPNA